MKKAGESKTWQIILCLIIDKQKMNSRRQYKHENLENNLQERCKGTPFL